ncbi:MAG: helix-turn-helix domain-containing protein [Fimbriimonadaceae bacterium]
MQTANDRVKVCPSCLAPLATHARCHVCQSLAGPRHAAGYLQLGLCQTCREDLARWRGPSPWPGRQQTETEAASDGLISSREAARILGVSAGTIRQMVADGRLVARSIDGPSKDKRGRRLRFRRQDVLRLARKERVAEPA